MIEPAGRGSLRVYLGAAPGVGKTYAMLNEGRRRAGRGTDVVVGFVEAHGRRHTVEQLADLEVLPRLHRSYRGSDFTELDLDALLARRPEVALVDELAHTNVPGGRNPKRWQDVEELLAAGIDVITTVNVQHLESLQDVVREITGISQQETVPDSVVRAAEQIELTDSTPEALRRRMAHGNIYSADKIDAALANYFRVGNLGALRELALLWLADRVDEGLHRYREQHNIEQTWPTRERVVVALTGGAESPTLIRRAARIVARASAGDLLAVHVSRSDGLAEAAPATLAQQRQLVESLGGTFHQVVGDNIAEALLDFARAENATQLVLGSSRRGRWAHFLTGAGIGATVTRNSGDIDVHIVTHEHAGPTGRLPRLGGGLSWERQVAGAALGVILLPVVTAILVQVRHDLALAGQILVYLVAVLAVTLVGGLVPALLAAVVAALLLNYFFSPPLHTLTIDAPDNIAALIVFLFVAVAVSSLVDRTARRTRQAARAAAEAETLSVLAGSVLRGEQAMPALLARLRETFGMESVMLLHGAEVIATAGAPTAPEPPDTTLDVPGGYRLALHGRTLPAADRRLVEAFATQAAAVLQQRELAVAAAAAKPLAELDRTRTALLAAVSHDLRTPLASAKAAVTSLRDTEVRWSRRDEAELLATADESLDQLNRLVDNLLDMSRLQAGALPVFRRPFGLDEIVPLALDDLGPDAKPVGVQLADHLPDVLADPTLVERILVNIVGNALRYAPAGIPPLITASSIADRVELRVVDHGPGIPQDARDRIFAPFQRLGDRDNSSGIGLGLALARGLAEAMGGSLGPEDTPGGGLTMVLSLPAAGRVAPAVAAEHLT